MWTRFSIKDLEALYEMPKTSHFLISSCVVFAILAFVFKSFVWLALPLLFFLCSLIAPQLFYGLQRGWFLLGLFMGWLMSPLFLTLFYFIIFVPMAIALKVLGHKPYQRHGWIKKNKVCDFTRPF